MKPARHNWIAWTLVSLFSVSGSFSGAPDFLCVSSAGHSRIESSGKACCNPRISSESSIAFEHSYPDETGCGDCNDIEVSSLLSINRSAKRIHDYTAPRVASISHFYSRNLAPVSFFDERNILQTLPITISQIVVRTTILIC